MSALAFDGNKRDQGDRAWGRSVRRLSIMSCPNFLEEILSLGTRLTESFFGESRRSGQPESAVAAEIEEVIERFTSSDEGSSMLEACRQALNEAGKIPTLLNWSQGLREALYALTYNVVIQSERYGPGSGELKRRFAIDLVTRIVRAYEPTPLFEVVEDVTFHPYIGILIDWTVEALNFYQAWPPISHVKLPGIYSGKYGLLLRLQAWMWTLFQAIRNVVTYPTAYERNMRDALGKLKPQVNALHSALPPASVQRKMDEIANIVVRLGKLTAPHVRAMISVLKIADELAGETQEERREVAFEVMKTLLLQAVQDNWFAAEALSSGLGNFLVREMTNCIDWTLSRNGLLPSTAKKSAGIYDALGSVT
ncbi:MAG: hypothetical protein WAL75_17230 [Terracidiphilus sp.]